MGDAHAHAIPDSQNEKALWLALALTTVFLIVEAVAGVFTNSRALISDAAHMLTDSAALAVALVAIRVGKRPADKLRAFGYYRFEILAAAFNAILLFLVAAYIMFEAWQRFAHPAEIQSTVMLVVAIVGLGINLVSMKLLSGGKDASLNVKRAYLEVWSDKLGSGGVIAGVLLIKATGWLWIDSVIAVGIGLWVLPRTWTLLRESFNILLEGVPKGLGLQEIATAMLALAGVASVHDLHVWAVSSNKHSVTVHLVTVLPDEQVFGLVATIRALLAERFDLSHSTVQIERTPCEQADATHAFAPAANDPAERPGYNGPHNVPH